MLTSNVRQIFMFVSKHCNTEASPKQTFSLYRTPGDITRTITLGCCLIFNKMAIE